jgi:hypothetical protein
MYERVTVKGEIIDLNSIFKKYPDSNKIYGRKKFSPNMILIPSDRDIILELLSSSTIYKFDGPRSSCNICNTVHTIGFTDENNTAEIDEKLFRLKYVHLYDNPLTNETFLIYKNFMIMNNNGPYMNNHLMLTLINHDPGNIKGSQYEILNREVLEDVINLYILVGENVTMGHNYSLTGSEQHFHIHMFLKESTPFRYDQFITELVDRGYNMYHALSNTEKQKTSRLSYDNTMSTSEDESYECNYYYSYISSTFITIFNHNAYGYKGIAITVKKPTPPISPDVPTRTNEIHITDFISTIHRILNKIESDGEYTFSLYLPSLIKKSG